MNFNPNTTGTYKLKAIKLVKFGGWGINLDSASAKNTNNIILRLFMQIFYHLVGTKQDKFI